MTTRAPLFQAWEHSRMKLGTSKIKRRPRWRKRTNFYSFQSWRSARWWRCQWRRRLPLHRELPDGHKLNMLIKSMEVFLSINTRSSTYSRAPKARAGLGRIDDLAHLKNMPSLGPVYFLRGRYTAKKKTLSLWWQHTIPFTYIYRVVVKWEK